MLDGEVDAKIYNVRNRLSFTNSFGYAFTSGKHSVSNNVSYERDGKAADSFSNSSNSRGRRGTRHVVGSLKMNTTLEYSTRVVQEGDRRCKKSTLNDLAYLTPLRIPLMNPVMESP
jgi:hypothetical protein